MQSFILAAGLGTRLKPLTDTMPKAMVPVSGEPLLEHTIKTLTRQGVNKIVINVHHFAQQIKDYISHHNLKSDISISDESEALLDTGGGLRKARHLFDSDKPILIHNVDILSNANLSQLYDLAQTKSALLLVSERQTQRYLLFGKDMRLKGWTNIATGEIRSPYPNLKVEDCLRYAFSGIHVFSPQLFELMADFPEKFSIMDFYLSICDRVDIYGHAIPNLKLLDVGKCDTLQAAETFLREM